MTRLVKGGGGGGRRDTARGGALLFCFPLVAPIPARTVGGGGIGGCLPAPPALPPGRP